MPVRDSEDALVTSAGATGHVRVSEDSLVVSTSGTTNRVRISEDALVVSVSPKAGRVRISQDALIACVPAALASPCAFDLQDSISALALRLYDPLLRFWTTAELTLYIQEAMRTWNSLTAYWRGDFTFTAQPSSPPNVFYDITDTSVAPTTLRPLTLTDTYLYTLIEYHLLEPPVGAGTWTGSAQFSTQDLIQAVGRRRDELLGVTGCTITRLLIPAAPGRTQLPTNIIDVRRIAFIPQPGLGLPSTLWEDDTWALGAFRPLYTTLPKGTPDIFTLSTEPWLTFDVNADPGVPGQYELLVVQSGQTLSQFTPSLLSVPDDWAWVVKWGALADLLGRESNAKDLLRAKYCEGRYRQGMQLLTHAPALLAMRSTNVPLQVDAIRSADLYQATWEAVGERSPSQVITAGLNLIALPAMTGTSGGFGDDFGSDFGGTGPVPLPMTATVVENAPVPVALGDCVLIGRDLWDIILDYAQHLAMFKCGGAEFIETMPLLDRFMQEAAIYASKLEEQGEFTKILLSLSQREEAINPRYTADIEPGPEN